MMEPFAQIEPIEIYGAPGAYDSYNTSSKFDALLPQMLALALTAVLWVWLWTHVISKVGYRGLSRKLWITAMCIPPIMPAAMILLLISPWPVYRQLRRQTKAGQELEAQVQQLGKIHGVNRALNQELEQMRRDLQ